MHVLDSVDKVIQSYFAAVTASTFTFKGVTYDPRPLRISPLVFRGFTCPADCGACCRRVTLDYLPDEPKPHHSVAFVERQIEFDGRQVPIWSFMQDADKGYHCEQLRMVDGRCSIHGTHPFPCDFELSRFWQYREPKYANLFISKLHERGHTMRRVTGEMRGLCEMTDATKETTQDLVRKLRRLKQWCEHFGLIKTYLDDIIYWCESGPHDEKLVLGEHNNRGNLLEGADASRT